MIKVYVLFDEQFVDLYESKDKDKINQFLKFWTMFRPETRIQVIEHGTNWHTHYIGKAKEWNGFTS